MSKENLELQLEQLEKYLDAKGNMIIKEVTQKVLIKDGIKILDCDVVKLIEDEVAKDDSYNSFKEVIYRTLKSNCSISLLKLEERCTYTSFFM